MLISEIQNIPYKKLVLVTGSPGAGKSTLCQQIALQNIASGFPVIYVITESTLEDLVQNLRDRGLGGTRPETLSIVDAYTQTVGLACRSQVSSLCATCADLNSISMAVTKLQLLIRSQDILLVFDSLTSPYLFNGLSVVKFMQRFLAKFAEEGNRVLVTMDEGCGRAEDLGAMMSVANAIIQLTMGPEEQTFHVIKHPVTAPTKIVRPIPEKFSIETWVEEVMHSDFIKMYMKSLFRGATCFRPRLGDYVNAFWSKLAYWSGLLWDPKGFPITIYEHNREDQSGTGSDEFISIIPQPYKTMFKLINLLKVMGIFPTEFKGLEDIRRMWWFGLPYSGGAKFERYGRIVYLPEESKADEYHYRIYENSDCWDLDGIGTTIASYLPPAMAGHFMGLENIDRGWNAVETKCIGLGDPYCEVKIFPGQSDQVKKHLQKSPEAVSRIHTRLMEKYTSHILKGEILTDRPQFGPDIHLQIPFHNFGFAHLAGDRSRMAIRMGGAKSGQEIAERLLSSGLQPGEVISRVFQSFETLKAGIVTRSGDIFTIEENIEPMRTWYMTELREPSCHFTTGFLSGIFRTVYGKRIREIKCLAAGDPVCEWEII